MPDQMRSDLNTLRRSYEAAGWRSGHEPIIGSPDCDALAENYDDRGRSSYRNICTYMIDVPLSTFCSISCNERPALSSSKRELYHCSRVIRHAVPIS